MRSATASRTLSPGSTASVRGTPSRANRWLAHRMVKPLVFVLACLPAVWLFWAAANDQLGANPAEALIRSLGDWSLRFLVLVLTVTPLREFTSWSALARLRRMIGLFVFFYVCLHLLAYAWFDMGFELGEIVADVAKRPFILVGMMSWVLLAALAATSFNRAIRRLGARRWQALHRGGVASEPLDVRCSERWQQGFQAELVLGRFARPDERGGVAVHQQFGRSAAGVVVAGHAHAVSAR